MARLPQPGGDAGNWGSILNDFLEQEHKTNGQLKIRDEFGSASGVATLDSSGKLLISQLPTSAGSSQNQYRYSSYTDGRTPVQAAQAVITAAGVGGTIVWDQDEPINLSGTQLVPLSGQTHMGDGQNSVFTSTTNQAAAFNFDSLGGSDYTFDSLIFRGGVTEKPTVPQRGRSGTAASFQAAIRCTGDLASAGAPQQKRVTVRNCLFEDIQSLPVFIKGIREYVVFEQNTIRNCLDPGFIFNEFVNVSNNRSFYSADNGLSVSRGNKRGIVQGNHIIGAAYSGIWVSGFEDDLGPENIIVSDNLIEDSGICGIIAIEAPQNLTISNNIIKNVRRGPVDIPNDDHGIGIQVVGTLLPGGSPDVQVSNSQIANNKLINCYRGGIYLKSTKDLLMIGNEIIDAGTQYLADGTTAIATNDFTQNFGIWCSELGDTNTAPIAFLNVIRDTRTPPRTNYPLNLTAASAERHTFNYAQNTNAAYVDSTQSIYGTWTFQDQQVIGLEGFRAAALASSGSSVTSHAVGFDSHGTAGAWRGGLGIMSNNLRRWRLLGANNAESGANTGTDFVVQSYADDGSALKELVRAERAGGVQMSANTVITAFPFIKASIASTTTTTAGSVHNTSGIATTSVLRKGRLLGMTIDMASPLTGGQLIATVQKNGSNTALNVTLTGVEQKDYTDLGFASGIAMDPGDTISVIITTTGYTAVTTTAMINVYYAQEL